jgi:adenine C2-methylase RlmN of 23S rRNA A2503 and tRNA A37
VRDEQDRAVERVQSALQLLDRRNVEMVRRLVEDQEVDASCGQKREQRARALAR